MAAGGAPQRLQQQSEESVQQHGYQQAALRVLVHIVFVRQSTPESPGLSTTVIVFEEAAEV